MTPFDYLNSITTTKEYAINSPEDEKGYNPFITNKGLSYFQDTILLANEMNCSYHLPKKLQYDFLFDMVRQNRRFPKWLKPTKDDNIEYVMDYYGYSEVKAQEALKLLSKEQVAYIVKYVKNQREVKNIII